MRSYRGACESKLEVLSQYKYSLCYENMPMAGYVTEKIFDCFYAGTVPIYLGATDVDKYVPVGSFVDMRLFKNVTEMYLHVQSLSMIDWLEMREVGRNFLRTTFRSTYFNGFTDSIVNHVTSN